MVSVNVGFVSLSEALDLTTPSGRALAGMLAIFAEFEHDILRDRVKAGIAQARKEGRPHGRPPSVTKYIPQVRALAKKGLSKSEISCPLRISRTSVRRFWPDLYQVAVMSFLECKITRICLAPFNDAEASNDVEVDEQAEGEFINLCRNLVAHSDEKIIRSQFPTVLEKAFQSSANASPLRDFENVAVAAWFSRAIETWRRAPYAVEANLSWNVAEVSKVMTVGFMEPPRGATTIDQLKDLVTTIVASAPVSLWESADKKQETKPLTITPDFSWSQFLKANLEWIFQQTGEALATYGPGLPQGKGINIVDDVLKELAGVMRLQKIKLPGLEG